MGLKTTHATINMIIPNILSTIYGTIIAKTTKVNQGYQYVVHPSSIFSKFSICYMFLNNLDFTFTLYFDHQRIKKHNFHWLIRSSYLIPTKFCISSKLPSNHEISEREWG